MPGLIALIAAIAVIAGGCAFLVVYDESLHRFPKREAMREGLRTALAAALFFSVFGGLLVVFLFAKH